MRFLVDLLTGENLPFQLESGQEIVGVNIDYWSPENADKMPFYTDVNDIEVFIGDKNGNIVKTVTVSLSDRSIVDQSAGLVTTQRPSVIITPTMTITIPDGEGELRIVNPEGRDKVLGREPGE